MAVTDERPTAVPAAPPARSRSRLPAVLIAVLAVALVATGGALAVITGVGGTRPPADDSVDAGFARDMITHHGQAVQMAQVARDRSTDPAVRTLAFDVETGQLAQAGQMRGWLQSWRLSQQTDRPVMGWMTGDHPGMAGMGMDGTPAGGMRMPGMASPAEMARLRSLSGRELDVYFLQLLIRHHQGGVPMAREGADRASLSYVRTLASAIVTAQSAEVVSMERMLRERGGKPLPPP